MEPLTQLLYTQAEAAEILRLHPNTVYHAIRQGRLRAARKGRRVLIHRDDLERFARADMPNFHQEGPARMRQVG